MFFLLLQIKRVSKERKARLENLPFVQEQSLNELRLLIPMKTYSNVSSLSEK